MIPGRANDPREVSHRHVALGQIETLVEKLIDHAETRVHHPRNGAVLPRHVPYPIVQAASALLLEVIVADPGRVHSLRDRGELQRAGPRLLHVVPRERELEVGGRGRVHLCRDRVRLQLDEQVVIDGYVVPLVENDRALVQVQELVVVEAHGSGGYVDSAGIHLGQPANARGSSLPALNCLRVEKKEGADESSRSSRKGIERYRAP